MRLIIIGALVYTIAMIGISIFVLQPPKPIIEIHGEPLIEVADFGNEMLDFHITNTLLTAWILTGVLVLICWLAVRRRSMIPNGFYNLFEALIEIIDNFITGIAGHRHGRRFFPLIATLFIYITFANWMGLTPIFNSIGGYVELHETEAEFHSDALVFEEGAGISLINPGAEFVEIEAGGCAEGAAGDECRHDAIEQAAEEHAAGEGEKLGVLFPFLRGINTDLMTPAAFALVSVLMIQYWGMTTLGFFRYAGKFINFKSPIDFFVGFLEIIAELAKVISFSFRLFGNMLAGEILLLVMTFLIAVASPVLVVFYGLELFVGAIQAFVFGALTLVFAMSAITAHDEHEHEHSEESAQH